MSASNSSSGFNLFGLLGASYGGGTSVSKSIKLMDHQNALWRSNLKWQNLNQYKYMRQGLMDADYNPLLALGANPATGEMPSAVANDQTFGLQRDPLAQANVAKANAETELIKNQTENLGNSPFNAFGNFVKGILGYSGESSTRAFTSIGEAVKRFGLPKVLSLSSKLQNITGQKGQIFDIGISNTDNGYIRLKRGSFGANNVAKPFLNGQDISISPEEQKIINFVLNHSRYKKYDNNPPKSYPSGM